MTTHRDQRIVKPSSTLHDVPLAEMSSLRWPRGVLVVVLLVIIGGAWLRAAEPGTKGAGTAGLQGLAWMAGEWKATRGEDILEERWSSPVGNSLIGTFRWIKSGGRVWMFELMTFTVEGEDVIFRLRHFSGEMVPWEGPEKEAALTYKLVKQTADESVFENPDSDSPRRFIFRKGKDSLTVVMEGHKDGKSTTSEFSFTRG